MGFGPPAPLAFREYMTQLCDCGKPRERHSNGSPRRQCRACRRGHEPTYNMSAHQRRNNRFKRSKACAVCGFVGHHCQMDVDHIDGDHANNDPENLQVLCANCHRMKTHLNGDNNNIAYRPRPLPVGAPCSAK